jgi:hypothetical protein
MLVFMPPCYFLSESAHLGSFLSFTAVAVTAQRAALIDGQPVKYCSVRARAASRLCETFAQLDVGSGVFIYSY